MVPNLQAGRQYDLPSQDTELSAFIPTIPEEYSGTSFRDVCLYLRNPPSANSDAGVLDELRELDPWGEFTDPQPVPAPDRDRYLTYIRFDHPLYLPLSYVLFYGKVVEVTARACSYNHSGYVFPFLSAHGAC